MLCQSNVNTVLLGYVLFLIGCGAVDAAAAQYGAYDAENMIFDERTGKHTFAVCLEKNGVKGIVNCVCGVEINSSLA